MKKWERLRAAGIKGWYRAYLRSHHWRRLRKKALAKARYRCAKCGRRDTKKDTIRGFRLNVHHKSYRRVGAERPSDLQVLCWNCHKKEHPTK